MRLSSFRSLISLSSLFAFLHSGSAVQDPCNVVNYIMRFAMCELVLRHRNKRSVSGLSADKQITQELRQVKEAYTAVQQMSPLPALRERLMESDHAHHELFLDWLKIRWLIVDIDRWDPNVPGLDREFTYEPS